MNVLGLDLSAGLLTLGLIQGMTYGILAVGLVLVYRSSRVINFAHGEIGAFGAAVCGVLVVKWSAPFWLAFVAGVAASTTVGAVTEVTVIRRLQRAPRLMVLVGTLGVAQFLLAFSAVVNSQARSGSTFPQPTGLPSFNVGALLVTRAYSAMLFLSPLIVAVLVLFLLRSRYGLAMRAAAANSERARMVGISAGRMSTISWAIAGAVAAYTTILLIPARGFLTAETLGPVLLLRALAPAVIARMTSLPIAMVAGLAIGVIDQVLIFNYPTSGVSEVFLLIIIAGALLLQTRRTGREQEKEDWAALQPWRPVPEALRRVWAIRNLGRMTALVALVVAVVAGLLVSNSGAVTLVAIASFALVGLSLGIITGLGGQLSLGQFALAGVGATASFAITSRVGNFVLGLVVAAVVTAVVSMLLGLPALRVRGLLLSVITLSFALAAQRWLLSQEWALGRGVAPGRPLIGSLSLEATRYYYFWALGVLLLGFLLAHNVWRGGVGQRLRALRDNEEGLRAFGVSPAAVKMQGFAIAGVLVGMGGAVYGHLLSRISAQNFDVVTSLYVVALSVLGGIGLLAGPLLGAFYIIGLPRVLPLDNAGLAATSLGWLLLIMYFPGGIAQLVGGPRARLIAFLARRGGVAVVGEPERAGVAGFRDHSVQLEARVMHSDGPGRTGGTVLRAESLQRHFGGVRAVDGVTFDLQRGEILGVIGPNGAGKTTLFELLGGFSSADAGTVTFEDRDVTGLRAEQRARLGLIRSFQDAALFPTLTVLETVTLSFERREPTNPALSCLGWQRSERSKTDRARELVSLMGLDAYREKQIRELSTGTRRITELACIVALEPVVLLLDEPSSGIAQRESEALGELVLRLRDHLRCTVMIIEHDIPLLMGLSTRVMAMDTGRVIAIGSPQDVRNDPVVVESYLGGNVAAIERSGLATAAR